MTDCLDPQRLAAFAERKLRRSEMPEVLAHLEECPRCMSALKAAMDLMEPRAQPSSSRWLALAASLVVLAGAAPFLWRALQTTSTERLVRLAPESARTSEARLTGGFGWAPYRGPMRSADPKSEAARMKLIGAAGQLVERAESDRSAEAQHAAGIGLVLVEKPEDAIGRLELATQRAPAEARAWSDLAAAEYMTALREGRASLYPNALAHVDRALGLDARLAEALFNRALILERLGLTQPARQTWDRYLLLDASSPWAAEAREHLRRLPQATGQSLFQRQQPQMETAAARGDQAAVDAFVDRYRQQSRNWGEAEYLGRWGEAALRGETEESARTLGVARAIGDALARLSGETLLRDAVQAIDRAPAERRGTLAEAHAVYRRGRMTYSRRAPAAAEPDLRRAAALFGGGPMALVARYYAANTRFDQNDVSGARRELEALRGETRYAALAAQIRWELALCSIADEDWIAAADLSAEAEQTFRKLGETSNLAFMQGIRSTALLSLGRPDEAWTLRAQSFAFESGEGRGNRLLASVGDAARVALRNGATDAARGLLRLEEEGHRAAGDPVELSNVLVRESLIDAGRAAELSREAGEIAKRITDPALRARAEADADFAAGAAMLPHDPRAARTLLTRALGHYRATRHWFYVPEALLLRARASLRGGDRDAALRDLRDGIDTVETDRRLAGSRRALLETIIPLELDRGDVAAAFQDADRLQARAENASLAALQKKLVGSDAAVLELAVLPDEIVAFCVTAGEVAVARTAVTPEGAMEAIQSADERRLYDLLIRPSAGALAGVRQLIVVADAPLQQVPFAALTDATTKRYLVESMTVAMAPSAGVLEPAARRDAPPSVTAVALPAGKQNDTVALPAGDEELTDIAALYPHATALHAADASLAGIAGSKADVLHIAGHTGRQPGEGDAALLFRGEPVTWSRVASMKLGTPVVVLAACETLRAPASAQSRSLSLGGGFLAAGATAVIGTLTPIADTEARTLFRAVHQELARGRGAAAALQQAQREAIRSDPGSAWRSVAVLTSRIERG